MVIGNGMRPDIWRAFVERFKIPTVLELYGSTEGNANICTYIDPTIKSFTYLTVMQMNRENLYFSEFR